MRSRYIRCYSPTHLPVVGSDDTQHRARTSSAGFASQSVIASCCAVRIDRQLGTQERPRSHCLWQLALSRVIGNRMQRATLAGRSILVVEDEPLIALDITQELEAAGAAVTTTNTLEHALILVEHDGLSGAILDHGLSDGDSSKLCKRLKEREIPFILYTGFPPVDGDCSGTVYMTKPAGEGKLSAALERLIGV